MKTRACALHAQEDVRIETLEVGDVGPQMPCRRRSKKPWSKRLAKLVNISAS